MVLFCEYTVPENHREAFLAWVRRHPELWRDAEFMESADQPGVFLEIRQAVDEEDALRKKAERRQGRSEWREMEGWIKGGRDGLRLWTFRSVSRDG
ncbi:hypothetical protein [Cohnella caldifontis]|uniref:hypothetical protein n=1 Tax=Cohnella caldifontis TaxID=3027471 RepID=UPI0023EC7F2B|nr:hypothetical protein [Cohnella sp. YIM B05605]